ncbi:PIN domain-containing protein [Nocardiopsis baichengensis]|uniref:PIN domain-containing protein n=1 Tax=Nocardiopsis baichengensis TaxID=280240 RepID=UPI000349E27C|nr:PIN domain-containing protein [Nocardiopsis baichengensis]
MTTNPATVVLDSQGLSAWLENDRKVVAMLQRFSSAKSALVIGANTIIEVSHARTNLARMHWILSQLKIEPVTEQAAVSAARLLKEAGVHGHKHAIDATVAEVALRQPGPVALLASDPDDMRRLCGERVAVVPV